MIRREEAVIEIYNRLYAERESLGLKSIKRTPTKPIDEKYLPCIFISEGVDDIVQHSSRGNTWYPCKRVLEVTLEMVAGRDTDISKLYRDVRSALFKGGIILADDNTFFVEVRTEGPTGYGLPDVIGIDLVVAVNYTDKGI